MAGERKQPRPLWSGSIVFGLVTIPIGLYTATRDRQIHFHMVTPDGKCRLRRKLVCPETGKEYEYAETGRGFEVAPDQYLVVDHEELAAMHPPSGDTLQLEKFIEGPEIDPLLFRTTYYLLPGKNGDKPYALLHQALKAAGRVGIGQFIMREKEYLAAVRAMPDVLALHTLYYEDEVVSAKDLESEHKEQRITQKEMQLANQLIDTLSEPFHYSSYHDKYRAELTEMLKKRAKGLKIKKLPAPAKHTPAQVINLMSRLEESLKQSRARSRKKAA